jgi:hypothetical protein
MKLARCAVWMGAVCVALAAMAQDNNFDQFRDPPKKPTDRPAANIALGAPYTMEPAPNDPDCADADDTRQLTDGAYSEGYFWVQKGTVGWRRANPAIVTLDLGADKPIRGASFHTAAGVADVTWPLAILVLVAGEDRQFVQAGDLVALSAKNGLPAAEGYSTHRFWTDELHTHGRYVAFVFTARPYAFVDEIEVYEGDPAWMAEPVEGERVADIKEHVLGLQVQQAIQRRLRWDIETLRRNVGDSGLADDVKRNLIEELDGIAAEPGAVSSDNDPEFKAILPLNPLHARVFAAQAALWQAQGQKPLTIWQSPLWDHLSHTDAPASPSNASVDVAMMLNEYRAGAFNISNATQEPVAATVRIAGLPGGANPAYITVHDAVWTGTKKGVPVLAALPEAKRDTDGTCRVSLTPGLTSQVWLTFNPRDIEPGTHRGAIEVTSIHGTEAIPLTLKIYPVQFPERPTLHFGGWDHTHGAGHRAVTEENIDALIVHMKEHFVDSPWAIPVAMPLGAYDASGKMTQEPDTAKFDDWFERWPDARQFLVFLSASDKFVQFAMDTPEFDAAVKAWTLFWADHVRGLGLKSEQLALLILDEPHAPEQDAIILAWAKAIRAADTGIRIWEDPVYRGDMTQANPDMIAACHVLCPNRPIFLRSSQAYRDYFVARRDEGIALEFYSCSGPVRSLDPYAYHRLQAWECWKYKAKAMYFWAFSDTGFGSSWNEYAASGRDYCPQFLDDKTVTAGKHMEAAREGIEDFEYLVMLRDAVAKAEGKAETGDAVEQARRLLGELPEHVLKAGTTESLWWHEDIDRNMADAARVKILDALVALGADK